MKIPVGIKAKQTTNMTMAARLRAPKISSRSHRLTIGKGQPRTESCPGKNLAMAAREAVSRVSTRGMQEPVPCHRRPTIRQGAGDRRDAHPALDTAAPEAVWRTYMRTTLPPLLFVRVQAVVPQDFHVSVA